MFKNEIYQQENKTTESEIKIQSDEKYIPSYFEKERLKKLFPSEIETLSKINTHRMNSYEDSKGLITIADLENENTTLIAGYHQVNKEKSEYYKQFEFKNKDAQSTFHKFVVNTVGLDVDTRYKILDEILRSDEKSNIDLENMNATEITIFYGNLLADNLLPIDNEVYKDLNYIEINKPENKIPPEYKNLFNKFCEKLNQTQIEQYCKIIKNDIFFYTEKPFDDNKAEGTYTYLVSKFYAISNVTNFENDVKNITYEHKRFPVEEQIQKTFNSIDELDKKLLDLPFKRLYYGGNIQYQLEQPKVEMVEVENIVGTTRSDTDNWEVNKNAPGRGPELIFEITKKVEEGNFDIHERSSDLLELVKVGESYFVSSGNHRMAALKAMGINKVPCVTSTFSYN